MSVKVVSALGGALLTSLLMTPFDVVKTRLQAQLPSSVKCEVNLTPTECPRCSHYIRFNGLQDFAVEKARGDPFIKQLAESDRYACMARHLDIPHYRGTVDAFSKIVRHEGVGALYNGLAPTLVLSLPSTVIYYVLYDDLSKKLAQRGVDTDVAAVSAGMGARWVVVVVVVVVVGCGGVGLGCNCDCLQSDATRYDLHGGLLSLSRSLLLTAPPRANRLFAATVISPVELVRTRIMARTGSRGGTGGPRLSGSGSGGSTVGNASRSGVGRAASGGSGGGVRNVSTAAAGGIIRELSFAVREGGVLSLWRGLAPTLLRDVPFSGIYWLAYENLKVRLRNRDCFAEGGSGRRSDAATEVARSFVSGALAGMVASVSTHPFDVLKTRQQVAMFSGPEGAAAATRGTGAALNATLQQLLSQGGFASLYAGLLPRLAKVMPACAIMITSYETGKMLWKQSLVEEEEKRKAEGEA